MNYGISYWLASLKVVQKVLEEKTPIKLMPSIDKNIMDASISTLIHKKKLLVYFCILGWNIWKMDNDKAVLQGNLQIPSIN